MGEPQAAARTRVTWTDRAVAAYPLAAAFLVLSVVYAYQAWRHHAPYVFGDELKWAELSRSLAQTGHAQLREAPASIGSLYTALIAPAWWLPDAVASYDAAKYINVLVMTAAIFPAYFLARLAVGRWAALFAAVGSAAVPGMAYSAMLIPEPLAYFWSAACLFLVAKALATRRPWWIAAAAAALLAAPLVRTQLAVLLAAAGVAVAVFAATGPRGRRTIGGWSHAERLGVAVLLVGGGIVLDAVLKHHSYSWQIGTYYSDRMLTLGVWALGAFTIGLGVFPVVAALAWILGGWRGVREPGERALYGVLVGAAFVFVLYTAVKASYLSTTFARRAEERNLIYLSPVVFAATAVWLTRLRASLVAVALAVAGVAYVLVAAPYFIDQHFYSDAPGLTILGAANRTWYWNEGYAQNVLLWMLALSAALLAGFELVRRHRSSLLARSPAAVAAVLAVLALAVLAWTVTAEIAAARASNDLAAFFWSRVPHPPDWVDRATGDEDAVFLGQKLADPNEFWSLEFWNRSLGQVWSLDATAPPPGPITTPDLLKPDGTLSPQLPVRWAIGDNGIHFVGEPVATHGSMVLYRLEPPLRIRDAASGTYNDGWMGSDSSFSQYSSTTNRPGTLVVSLSRAGFCPDKSVHAPVGHATIRLGDVRVRNRQPALGRVRTVRRLTIPNCDQRVVRIPATPPFRVETHISPTFSPADYGSTDVRALGAVANYSFEDRR